MNFTTLDSLPRFTFPTACFGPGPCCLQGAGYITISKQFVDDKPLTTAALTPQGKEALEHYLAEMEQLIQSLKPGKSA